MIDYKLPQQALSQPYSQEFTVSKCPTYLPSELYVTFVKVDTVSGARFFALATRPGSQASPLDSDGFHQVRQHSCGEAKELAEQWKKLVLDRNAAVNANGLTSTVKPLFQALSRLGPGAIDLRGLPTDKVNGVHLAVVLRATFSMKTRTPGWEEALGIARNALKRDCIDEADALSGLI
jgi:hypothetical protein